jgi:ubiquinone biosynthesis protein
VKATSSVRRATHIFRVAVSHLVVHALHAFLGRWPILAAKIPGQALPGPERLRLAIEDIGGIFIKFGQMLAMQSDLLPLEYCRVLFTLFDQVPAFSYEEVEQTFVEDLKQTPLQIFTSFDRTPIATGSIGQVHAAALGTQKVAVKIRRPAILSEFAADIASMKLVVGAVKLLRSKRLYWIIAPTEEFIFWTQEELDFRREAHYMDELGRNAEENRFEKVPKVLWSCTTARILTAEFLDGVTLSEYLRGRESGSLQLSSEFDANVFAGRLIDNFLGDAFRHGMFHADLHPGNLMILKNNVVGYVDFGISGVLSRYSRRYLIAMTLAYARGDLDEMCESFFRISTFGNDARPHGFRLGVKNASDGWYGNGPGQRRLRKSITSIMLDLLIISKDNGVWPQRDVIKYIRSAIALDGLIKTFSPQVDIGRHLEQSCERHIKWDSYRTLTSFHVAINLLGSMTGLVRDGFLRAVAGLNRTGTNNSAVPPSLRDSKTLRKVNVFLQLSWITFCLALPGIFGRRSVGGYFLQASGMLLPIAMSIVIWRALKKMHVPSP